MRVIFITNLIYSDQSRTGSFATRKAEMAFIPALGMDIEALGLENALRVMEITVDIDNRKYDAYINLDDISCPTEQDFKQAVVHLRDNGWDIKGQ